MAEYIERESTLHRMKADIRPPFAVVADMPAADVAPVRHGEWLFVDNDGYWYNECSVCGGRTENHDGSPPGYNYCPDCGAKMDLKGE